MLSLVFVLARILIGSLIGLAKKNRWQDMIDSDYHFIPGLSIGVIEKSWSQETGKS